MSSARWSRKQEWHRRWASSVYGNRLLSSSADNKWSSQQPRAGEHVACQVPGVEVLESGWSPDAPKVSPWRPPASTRPRAKSFVSGGNTCK
jgi:hypothetical protein